MNVIGTYGICNTKSILVHKIEDDKVLASINNKNHEWCDIDDQSKGFYFGGIYVPFNEVMRVDI